MTAMQTAPPRRRLWYIRVPGFVRVSGGGRFFDSLVHPSRWRLGWRLQAVPFRVGNS